MKKKPAFSIVYLILIIALVIAVGRDSTNTKEITESLVKDSVIIPPKVAYGMILNGLDIEENKIKRNDVLSDLLSGYSVSGSIMHQFATLSRKVFDVRKMAAEKKYAIIYSQDSLKVAKALIYEPNDIDYVIFHLDDSLRVDLCSRQVEVVEKTIAGEIRENLSETIEELGISHQLTNRFVDIFGWQVDFQRLQKGDRFKLVYEEKQVEGKSVGIDDITAIYFVHANTPYYAFPYDQGDGLDFFDSDGKSLRKALLKYPIEFTRISSRYTMNRFHPVLKRNKPHLGTDFAAPTGTPIRAVGDGLIEEAQYKSNNGNYVKIRHNGTFTTQYLHMSKIAEGVRQGTRVRQGQTIGFVGSTGLATGPHLCYRFWKNGVQVDALKVELPPSQPINEKHLNAFEVVKQTLTKKLDKITFPVDTKNQVPVL